jgi:hypothetical protein
MFSKNELISKRQFECLLILDIFGTNLFILPRLAVKQAGGAAWL